MFFFLFFLFIIHQGKELVKVAMEKGKMDGKHFGVLPFRCVVGEYALIP